MRISVFTVGFSSIIVDRAVDLAMPSSFENSVRFFFLCFGRSLDYPTDGYFFPYHSHSSCCKDKGKDMILLYDFLPYAGKISVWYSSLKHFRGKIREI